MRQEVISDEEAQEYKVIHDSLKVERVRQLEVLEFQIKILSDHSQLHELELNRLSEFSFRWIVGSLGAALVRQMARLIAPSALLVLFLKHSLSQNVEVRFMSAQTQHYQVSICSVDAMRGVGVIVLLCSLRSDEVQNFVFTFSRD